MEINVPPVDTMTGKDHEVSEEDTLQRLSGQDITTVDVEAFGEQVQELQEREYYGLAELDPCEGTECSAGPSLDLPTETTSVPKVAADADEGLLFHHAPCAQEDHPKPESLNPTP